MENSFARWHLGLGFVIVTAAFGFSLKAANRYNHAGLTLLCASLGIEALANLLSFLLIALDSGKLSSFSGRLASCSTLVSACCWEDGSCWPFPANRL